MTPFRPYGYPFPDPQPKLPPPSFIIYVLIAIILTILLVTGIAKRVGAQEIPAPAYLTASWYSIASLKQEGTYKYSKGVMANGQIFRDDKFTAASRLYRLGTYLKISNKDNGKSVCVKVTDRISKRFAKTRIDLSKAAFGRIALHKQGIIKIKVEVVRAN